MPVAAGTSETTIDESCQRSATELDSAWSLPVRIGFRFAFCYLLLSCLPDIGQAWIFETIPLLKIIGVPWIWLAHKVMPWIAIHVLHLSGQQVTYFPTGSGDTTLEYVKYAVFAITALLATAIWSVIDRKRKQYDTLHGWLRVLVRLTLAITLFDYGLAKAIPTQFQQPRLARLTETYGASSPMGILWTFMGASMPYTIFAGLAELTAGVLLIFRRTTLLGALVAAGVMLNVAMLNYCYDVPVKLYSTNLLLMALFLAIPERHRLANLFFLNRTALPSTPQPPHFERRWVRVTVHALLFLLFACHAALTGWGGWQYLREIRGAGKYPLYGVYDVESVARNGIESLPSTLPAELRWTEFLCDRDSFAVRRRSGILYFQPQFDTKAATIDLKSGNSGNILKLNYATPDSSHLTLITKSGSDTITMYLVKADDASFGLTSRGFHWISEYPFNR